MKPCNEAPISLLVYMIDRAAGQHRLRVDDWSFIWRNRAVVADTLLEIVSSVWELPDGTKWVNEVIEADEKIYYKTGFFDGADDRFVYTGIHREMFSERRGERPRRVYAGVIDGEDLIATDHLSVLINGLADKIRE